MCVSFCRNEWGTIYSLGLFCDMAWMDHITVLNISVDENLTHSVQVVLHRIQSREFQIQMEMCMFRGPRTAHSTNMIDENGRKPNPNEKTALQNSPAPSSKRHYRHSWAWWIDITTSCQLYRRYVQPWTIFFRRTSSGSSFHRVQPSVDILQSSFSYHSCTRWHGPWDRFELVTQNSQC